MKKLSKKEIKRFWTIVLILACLFLLLYFFISFAHLCPLLAKRTPVWKTANGKVQGRVSYSSRRGKEFWQFLGIPYAVPPVGKLRFQPPVPLTESWEGIKSVVKYPDWCLQYESVVLNRVTGSEDCLYLNVFVSSPHKSADAQSLYKVANRRPVFVHIHGGGFQFGGSRFHRPEIFMDHDDIVLVTFNYRLGPLGFLNLAQSGNKNSSSMQLPRGNMGLKDQLVVLQWVQTNIVRFGGDPNNVTIFGESAGAASVHFHMLSPKSKGLFHRAISFSGTALNPWSFSKDLRKISEKYVRGVGCSLKDNTKFLECLQSPNLDLEKMLRLQSYLKDPSLESDMLVPSIELVETNDTFLTNEPLNIIRDGRVSKTPWMLGVNSADGLLSTGRFQAETGTIKRLQNNWNSMVASFHPSFSNPHNSSEIANSARIFYFGSNQSLESMETELFYKSITALSSEVFFCKAAHEAATEHARNGAPTYLFYYNYTSVFLPSTYSTLRAVSDDDLLHPLLKQFFTVSYDWWMERIFGADDGPRRFGISHAEELYQIWNLQGLSAYLAFGDGSFSNEMLKAIINFGKNGDRSPIFFSGAEWPALSPSDVINGTNYRPLPTMLMDNAEKSELIYEPYAKFLDFWFNLTHNSFFIV